MKQEGYFCENGKISDVNGVTLSIVTSPRPGHRGETKSEASSPFCNRFSKRDLKKEQEIAHIKATKKYMS